MFLSNILPIILEIGFVFQNFSSLKIYIIHTIFCFKKEINFEVH